MLASVALGRPGHYTFDTATFNSIPVGILPSLLSTSDTFYFPALISRITLAVQDVRLADIDRWPGGLGWLPSYSSGPLIPSARTHGDQALEKRPRSLGLDAETNAVHAFYRLAAKTYFFRRLHDQDLPMTITTLAYPPFIAKRRLEACTEEAINVLAQIPSLSCYDSALLWPLSVVANAMTSAKGQAYVIKRLRGMEERFGFDEIKAFREALEAMWMGIENGRERGKWEVRLVG
ncbi:hypothetical protein LTS18_006124 [Coniosporium uncinatum]|uniref:Uncharacterized protein n=1 Tax=Coniosporium uncinatum TaxID=93489 RepID=A0ACC3D3W4_9PEZI|nr:hypothetical protein LTS18_006124 [Coniosporium uncinatum]